MVTLYSSNCLNCEILKRELDNAHVQYQVCNDIAKMIQMGFNEMPILQVNEIYLNMREAITWIKKGAVV